MAADKGALALMIAGGDKGGEPMGETYSSFDSLAKSLGIPPERKEAARAALKSFVMECMSEGDGEDIDLTSEE